MIQEFSLQEKAAYLAAFIDGEGWISYRRHIKNGERKGRFSRQIGFTNTDEALFFFVLKITQDLGLDFHTKRSVPENPKHSPSWKAFLIGGEKSFRRFAERVPLQHSGKKSRLLAIIEDFERTKQAGRQRAPSLTLDATNRARFAHLSAKIVGKSGVRGVRPSGRRWRAVIQHRGKKISLGSFAEMHEAATAYKRAATELFGSRAS